MRRRGLLVFLPLLFIFGCETHQERFERLEKRVATLERKVGKVEAVVPWLKK